MGQTKTFMSTVQARHCVAAKKNKNQKKMSLPLEENVKKISIALNIVCQVLKNRSKRVSSKTHEAFLIQEAENIAFLVARVQFLYAPAKKNALTVLRFINEQNLLDHRDPSLMIAMSDCELKVPKAEIAGYPDEFPKAVIQNGFLTATRVFVAEALASWSFYNKNTTKLTDIVNVGLRRTLLKKQKDLIFSGRELSPQSEYWVYFVTHVVLVATMWGELHEPLGGTAIETWDQIIKLLRAWIVIIEADAKQNLEVFIELLFCLDLLKQTDIVDRFKGFTDTLFMTESNTRNQHRAYHTYVLWALFYAKRVHILNLPIKSDSEKPQTEEDEEESSDDAEAIHKSKQKQLKHDPDSEEDC